MLTGKVLIPGINISKRHLKSQGQGKPGGIIDKLMDYDEYIVDEKINALREKMYKV